MSDPTSNKASTAALSVVGYVVWPSLGLQQSCPAPTKASVAKPATKKPVAKESAAKPAPVKESKLTAKLTEIAGQESKITAIKISGPTAEVTVSRKEGETSSQLVQQGEQWLITGKEATAPQTKPLHLKQSSRRRSWLRKASDIWLRKAAFSQSLIPVLT